MPISAIIAFLIFLFGMILSVVNSASWAFYTYEIYYFLNPSSRWWGSSIPDIPYSLLIVLIMMVSFYIHKKKDNYNKLADIPYINKLIFFLFYYCIVYFFAIDPGLHFKFGVEFMKLFIILSFAYKVLNSEDKLHKAIWAYLIGATFIAYEAYVVGRNVNGRVEGIGMIDAPEANGTAAVLVPAIPLLIYYFWKGSKKIKVIVSIFGVLILNAIVLINSRGAFLGVFVGATYYFWMFFFGQVKVKSQKLIVIFFIALSLIATAVVVDDSFIDRMNTINNIEDESKSGSHRYRYWLIALDESFKFPFGYGAYGYELMSPYTIPEELFTHGARNKEYKAVHSLWFQALSEVGWIGLLLFLSMIFSSFVMIKKMKEKASLNKDKYQYYFIIALQAGFVGELMTSSFINQFRVQIIYWLMMFIAILYSLQNKKPI